MLRFIVEGLLPLGLVAYTMWVTMSRWKLKRLLASLDDPLLCLSRRERRAHAREVVQREKDAYVDAVYRSLIGRSTPTKGDAHEEQ